MQRKAYVPGAAVLLAALLAACTSGSGSGDTPSDSKAGVSTSATAAQPGKYRTLSDACTAIGHGTLDSLLPGIKQVTDEDQRDKAYEGDPELTYDNDRRSGCRWKAESTTATDRLFVDFERVVSYDNSVSDDARASRVFGTKEVAADLPEPSSSAGTSTGSATPSDTPSESASADPSESATGSQSASATPADLQPRTLDGLGDEAYLDDELSTTSRQRTVTVVFRTSNVVVTIEYAEQPASTGDAPSSKDMQDRARKLAQQLADSFE